MFWQESKDKQFYSLQSSSLSISYIFYIEQPFRSDSYRALDRPSFKPQPYQQSRPSSQPYLQKSPISRPYSTSYDRRTDMNSQHQNIQSPSLNRVQHQSQTDLRQSFKQQNLKGSLLINPQQQFHYSSQKPQQRNSSQQPQMRYCQTDQRLSQSPIHMSERRPQSSKNFNSIQQSIKKNEVDSQQQVKVSKQEEVQEYKKLQDKLQFLESKIQNIKSHIHTSNQQLIKNFKNDSKQKGLTAKFFSNQKKDEGKENKGQIVTLLKQSQNINPKEQQKSNPQQGQDSFHSNQKQPLAQYITQVKPSTPSSSGTTSNKTSNQLSIGKYYE